MGTHLRVLRTIQWIPTWEGLDDIQISLHPCALGKSSLSIGRGNVYNFPFSFSIVLLVASVLISWYRANIYDNYISSFSIVILVASMLIWADIYNNFTFSFSIVLRAFFGKKILSDSKKKEKKVTWFLTDESGFEIFCQTPKKKKCKFKEYSL